jgi:preprotein translocase subunit SecD
MILFALALLAQAQPACPPDPTGTARDRRESSKRRPVERSGKGLWIGGISFGPGDLVDATVSSERYTRSPIVNLHFSAAGKVKFDVAQRCRVGHPIEISVDRKLVSRPNLDEPVAGAEMTIAGRFSQQSATALANRLRAAAGLPALPQPISGTP